MAYPCALSLTKSAATPRWLGCRWSSLGNAHLPTYAVYETDYAKFSSALERGGAVVLREFITFEGSAVSGKRGVYGQNHHH